MIIKTLISIVIATVVICVNHYVSNSYVAAADMSDALSEANEQLDSLLRNSASLSTANDSLKEANEQLDSLLRNSSSLSTVNNTLNGTTNITTVDNNTMTTSNGTTNATIISK